MSKASRAAAVVALVTTLCLPSQAGASFPCSQDSGVVSISLGEGDSAAVGAAGGFLTIDGVPCASAALADVDHVVVRDAPSHDVRLTLLVPTGGFTTPDGDEITWAVRLGDGADALILQGIGHANRVKVSGARANLNKGSTSTYELESSGAEFLELRGGGGDDHLRVAEVERTASGIRRTSGTRVAGATLGTYPSARIFGGAGDDTINGDDNVNVIWSGDGNDKVFGKGGDDEVQGGEGNDELYGGDGDDLVNGGNGDDLEGAGPGNDLFQQASQDVYTSAGAVSIPDVGKALSPVSVPETTLSSVDVNVRVYIDHPATEDIWVSLITPGGTRVRLAERRGNGNSFNGTQFDSEAFTNIKTAPGPSYNGRFHPEWSMEPAQASNPTGQWTLWVEDKVSGSVGTISGWELELGMPTADANGADDMRGGGSPNDLVVYSQRTQSVTATLNGGADDGQALEGDALGSATTCPATMPSGSQCADLEWAYAGTGDDTIAGTDQINDLRGAAGHDTITALDGNDQLRGANGQDNITAGAGNDVIHGQGNPDTIDGGPGADRAIYGYAPVGMTIDLSVAELGSASDGDGPGRNDDDILSFIEHITGTAHADDITGTDGVANSFAGAGGDDFLDGGTGTGNDNLDGAGGIDTCLNGETTSGCENTG